MGILDVIGGRPPERWLNDTGTRYDMVGKNELLLDDPRSWDMAAKMI